MQRILVASPQWLKRHGAPRVPLQLTRDDCLIQVTPAGCVVPWFLECSSVGDAARAIEVRGRLRSNAPSALRDLALDGAGIAFLPDWLVSEDVKRGRLRRVLPKWASSPITAWLIHRAELRGAPRIRAFLDAMPKTSAQAGLATAGARRSASSL